MKSILIIDDNVKTSKYKKWLENEERFNSTLINDPNTAELNFKSADYDLVLIGFKMSVMDGFNLYDKLHETSKKLEDTQKNFKYVL
jgi:DNA-binding response OmpR family regulator